MRVVADVAVDACGVGPIRLDSDDIESMLFNQAARDRRSGLVEFRSAMARLPEKDNLRIRKTIEICAKFVDLVRWREGFAKAANDGGGLIGALGPKGLGEEENVGHQWLSL
jgi:hypothetical protein